MEAAVERRLEGWKVWVTRWMFKDVLTTVRMMEHLGNENRAYFMQASARAFSQLIYIQHPCSAVLTET